jgi:hypothetical protein
MIYTDNDDNITDTRLKLEESTYFLDQARINQNRWKFFNFYINAFFSSAYSMPEVMQMEFQKRLKDPEDFYKWAEEAKHRLNSQFPSEFRENIRNQGIHLEGNIRKRIRSKVSASVGVKIIGKDWYFDRVDNPVQEYRWKLAGEDELLVDKCKRYLDALALMVDECENKFLT